MPTININDKPYELDQFSDKAKADLQMMQITDREIARLNAELAIAQTARNAYAKSLEAGLPASAEKTIQ